MHGFVEANGRHLADIISTVEFDQTGNYLATGDKGGRVVLFERNETVCANVSPFCRVSSHSVVLQDGH